MACYRRGEFDRARQWFAEAAKRGRDPWTWLWFARAQARLGDPSGSIESIRRALEISPGFPEARYELEKLEKVRKRLKRREGIPSGSAAAIDYHIESGDALSAWNQMMMVPTESRDPRDLVRIGWLLRRDGHLTLAFRAARQAYDLEPEHEGAQGIHNTLEEEVGLLRQGFQFPPRRMESAYRIQDSRIFYLIRHSLAQQTDGYATRTHALLHALVKEGYEAIGMSELKQRSPIEIRGEQCVIDDVTYRWLPYEGPRLNGLSYIEQYARSIEIEARRLKPGILHAASNYRNGLAANLAARRLGIPSIYEVRGLWDISRISRDPSWAETEGRDFYKRMEVDAACGADVVITITEALRDELVTRGVPAEQVVVVPNGVDTARFVPVPRDQVLESELGFQRLPVIGYVGSIKAYEGLDLLFDALARLKAEDEDLDFRVLIVGDGPALDDLKVKARTLRLEGCVTFTGAVPHDQVARYYSLIDIAPLPRRSVPVTEMVSPLKPFEAMALEKALVISNVAAMREIIIHDQTGLVFERDNERDFAKMLRELLRDPDKVANLGQAARQWVVNERDWINLAGVVRDIYDDLRIRSIKA